jgi:hypothetical protein
MQRTDTAVKQTPIEEASFLLRIASGGLAKHPGYLPRGRFI